MKNPKKEIEKKRNHFTALLGRIKEPGPRQALTEKILALDAELDALAELPSQASPEPQESAVVFVDAPEGFAEAFRAHQQALWLQAHKSTAKALPGLQKQVSEAIFLLEGFSDYLTEKMRLHAYDGRPLTELPTKPDPHCLYVAGSQAQAKDLDQAGYVALWLKARDADAAILLAGFAGSDIVLTDPALHSLAAALDPDRFTLVCVDCWPGNRLDVVGTVPMLTHLLSLAERQDVVPVQSSAHGRLAKQMFAAFDAEDEAKYRALARQVVAA